MCIDLHPYTFITGQWAIQSPKHPPLVGGPHVKPQVRSKELHFFHIFKHVTYINYMKLFNFNIISPQELTHTDKTEKCPFFTTFMHKTHVQHHISEKKNQSIEPDPCPTFTPKSLGCGTFPNMRIITLILFCPT